MAYVNVEEWECEQVGEWVRGLGDGCLTTAEVLEKAGVGGRRLLQLSAGCLEEMGIWKVGHQELLLEALEQLRLFQHELHRENLQLLALRVTCRARSLLSALRPLINAAAAAADGKEASDGLPTHVLGDIAYLLDAAKDLLSWLHRPPFESSEAYRELERELMSQCMSLAVQSRRERFVENPLQSVYLCGERLELAARTLVEDWTDPLVLQPASLDVATLRRRRTAEDLGLLFLDHGRPGIHLVAAAQLQSPAHLSGKLHRGDEVVQVNYQTVVGWDALRVGQLLEGSSSEAILTLKRRPRHASVFGQMYMRPFRLPSKQQQQQQRAFVFWAPPPPLHLQQPSITIRAPPPPPPPPTPPPPLATSESSEDEEEEEEEVVVAEVVSPPLSTRFYLPKPRPPVQRRATVTGASPTSTRPPLDFDCFWAEIEKRRSKRRSGGDEEDTQIRRPSPVTPPPPRPATCIGTRTDYPDTPSPPSTPSTPLTPVSITSSSSRKTSMERPRLDKSQSTPAYDMEQLEQGRQLARPEPRTQQKCSVGDDDDKPLEGWLYKCEKSSATRWSKRWFVLRRHLLHCYVSPELASSGQGESVLHVAGLKATNAPEVRSRPHAFKLFHSGASFYFAADSKEEHQVWIERLSHAAALSARRHQDVPKPPKSEDKGVVTGSSGGDGRPGDDAQNIRKASSSPSLQQPPPKKSGIRKGRTHDEKGRHSGSSASSSSSSSVTSAPSLCASLDRKYLQLLSLARVSPERPVPTAKYRSYRRVTATSPPPPPFPPPPPPAAPPVLSPACPPSPDAYQDRSPEQRWLSSLRSTLGLKSTALYHPVRRSQSNTSTSPMHMAFEMNLDDAPLTPPPPPPPAKPTAFKQLKQLLSPRPHRRPPPPESVFVLPPALPPAPIPAPTMGVAMIGKQRRTPPPSAPPVPDYPHLKYPPIFEPGTYSLRASTSSSGSTSMASVKRVPSDLQPRKV